MKSDIKKVFVMNTYSDEPRIPSALKRFVNRIALAVQLFKALGPLAIMAFAAYAVYEIFGQRLANMAAWIIQPAMQAVQDASTLQLGIGFGALLLLVAALVSLMGPRAEPDELS